MTLRAYGFGTATGEAKILDQIDNMAGVISKNGSNPIDPDELCRKAAASVIFGIVLGKSFTFDDPELKSMLDVLEKFFDAIFDEKLLIVEMLPLWLSGIVLKDYRNAMQQSVTKYRNMLLDCIRSHVQEFDPDNPRDVIDGYIKERGADNFDASPLAGNIIGFTSDAVMTMASIFNGAMYYIAKYPDVQARVQEQLDAVVGSSRKVTTKDKSSLPLVEAVVCETLRLMSVTTLSLPHVTPRDTTLNGYNIPKGSYVMANIWAIHMNPETYKDPEHFALEHFLQEDGSVVRSPECFVPFGVGRYSLK